MQKKEKIERESIIAILEVLFAQPNIYFDDELVDFAMQFLKNGGDFADGVIANYVNTFSNSKLLTFDKKLHKLCEKFYIQYIEL